MNRCIIIYLTLSIIQSSFLLGQNQCVYKPKIFPSAFSQLNSDYYGLANQPATVNKGSFQLETVILIKNIIKEDYNDTKEQTYTLNLIRVGIGNNLEFRSHLNGIIFNGAKDIQIGTGIKYSKPTKFRAIPFLSVLLDYTYSNSSNNADFSFISETNIRDAVSFSTDIGFRYNEVNNFQLSYGIKSLMKPQKSKTGIFVIASNKHLLIDKSLLFGILYTNNKTFNITFSYGLTEEKSLFKSGLSINL